MAKTLTNFARCFKKMVIDMSKWVIPRDIVKHCLKNKNVTVT